MLLQLLMASHAVGLTIGLPTSSWINRKLFRRAVTRTRVVRSRITMLNQWFVWVIRYRFSSAWYRQ